MVKQSIRCEGSQTRDTRPPTPPGVSVATKKIRGKCLTIVTPKTSKSATPAPESARQYKLLKKLTKGSYDLSLKDDIHMNTFRDSLRRNFKLLGDTATTTRLYVTAEASEIQPEIRTQKAHWYFTGKPTQYDQAESISKVLCRAVLPHFQHAETRTKRARLPHTLLQIRPTSFRCGLILPPVLHDARRS